MKIDIQKAAKALSKGWGRYRDLFGAVPHGSPKQIAALLEMSHTEDWSKRPVSALGPSDRCPYCGHALKKHNKEQGCMDVVPSQKGLPGTDLCRCERYPDSIGRWRR